MHYNVTYSHTHTHTYIYIYIYIYICYIVLVRLCGVVGSTLAIEFIVQGFESEHRLFSHHSASAFSKLRSLADYYFVCCRPTYYFVLFTRPTCSSPVPSHVSRHVYVCVILMIYNHNKFTSGNLFFLLTHYRSICCL